MTRSPLIAGGGADKSQWERKIKLLIETYRVQLGIAEHINVAIVPNNPRLISVEYVPGRTDLFRMVFEEPFLLTLGEKELGAAVAHEMGHVWIYTHFPFLQTEVLANQQAQKLVPRDDLGKVYEKVWKWNGETGNLAEVLGSNEEPKERGGTGANPHGNPRPLDTNRAQGALEGPRIFLQSRVPGKTGISGATADTALAAAGPEVTRSFDGICPSCVITADKAAADYIADIAPAQHSTDATWMWSIYKQNGTLLKQGYASTLTQSAQDALAVIMAHWHSSQPRH